MNNKLLVSFDIMIFRSCVYYQEQTTILQKRIYFGFIIYTKNLKI